MTDTGRERKMTAGLDLGDRYSYLYLIDNDSGELLEEGRLRTTPADLRRRFDSEERLTLAIEVGSHSTWVSRLLEEYGHEVLVANPRKTRLIYGDQRKTDKLDARKLARLARADPELLYPVEHRGIESQTHLLGLDPLPGCTDPLSHPADQPRPGDGQVFRGEASQMLRRELPQKGRRCAALRTRRSPRRHSGDRRLTHRTDQGLREAHRAGLPRVLPAADRATQTSSGSRGTYVPDLRVDPGGPAEVR